MGNPAHLTCHLCGQDHLPAPLVKGEMALCARCGAVMAKGARFGPDAAFAFSVTGLILAVPAALLPFISAGKLGNERMSHLLTGVGALWDNGMRMVALLVLLCGTLLPVALLAAVAVLRVPERFGWRPDARAELARVVQTLEHACIPEVQVLAVLVALMKLGSVVEVTIGPAFWFYCAMALAAIMAQQSFKLEPPGPPAGADAPQSP
jgi:paraquat-inducible protein A